MIEKIEQLSDSDAKSLLKDLIENYFAKGFGEMNKTEFETMLYYVFRKHGLLKGKCFDDSLKLKITEAKARKLIYESKIKYESKDQADLDCKLREYIGNCLINAKISRSGNEVKFGIEDKYYRVALNAKLRDNNFYADTSFNKEIVSLDVDAFVNMISLLVPNFQKQTILNNLEGVVINEETRNKEGKEFLKGVIMGTTQKLSIDIVKKMGSLLASWGALMA